jgi:hypothetical protein
VPNFHVCCDGHYEYKLSGVGDFFIVAIVNSFIGYCNPVDLTTTAHNELLSKAVTAESVERK